MNDIEIFHYVIPTSRFYGRFYHLWQCAICLTVKGLVHIREGTVSFIVQIWIDPNIFNTFVWVFFVNVTFAKIISIATTRL